MDSLPQKHINSRCNFRINSPLLAFGKYLLAFYSFNHLLFTITNRKTPRPLVLTARKPIKTLTQLHIFCKCDKFNTYKRIGAKSIRQHHPLPIRIVLVVVAVDRIGIFRSQTLILISRQRSKTNAAITVFVSIPTYLLTGSTIPEPVEPNPCPSVHPNFCNILKPILSSLILNSL